MFCCFGSNHLEEFLEQDVPCRENHWTITVREFIIYQICRWKVYLYIIQRVLSQILSRISLPKTITFMFLKFWNSYFQGYTAIVEWLCSLFLHKCFTINGNVLHYESHFACQFISNRFSVINKVGFHNSKVKTQSFLSFYNLGMKPLLSNFALLGNS